MDKSNEVYTHGHHPVVVEAHARRTAAEAAAFLLPSLTAGIRLLDIGCGPGSITIGLADHVGLGGSVVGIDNSGEAIKLARRAAADTERISFEVASVYDIPFEDASFDVAYGHQILQHLTEPVAALVEVRRVLRPGGLVAVRDADFGSMTYHPQCPELDSWLEVYRAVARSNGGEPDAGRRLPEWLRAAGFIEPIVTSSTWTYATGAARAAWAELWAERTMLPRFADRAGELGVGNRRQLLEIAGGWHTWAEAPDGWFGFIHGEVVARKPDS